MERFKREGMVYDLSVPVAKPGAYQFRIAVRDSAIDQTQQASLERVEAAGRLQLGSELEPGEYFLQVVVTDALAGKSNAVASQWIDFELVN